MSTAVQGINKLPNGIVGFDFLADGGLPAGRTTLISGTLGSAKTVFAAQFLAAGITQFSEPGVFVTFEESVDDIRRNLMSLGVDVSAYEAAGQWRFVDVAPRSGDDLGALLARIKYAIITIGARRAAVDSVGAIYSQFDDEHKIRRELFRINAELKGLNVTTVMTADRSDDYGPVARHGVEEFVADNAVILRNPLDELKRRRTLEILKFRGTSHYKGEFPFSVILVKASS